MNPVLNPFGFYSFIDFANRSRAEIVAKLTNMPYECALNGHQMETIKSGYLYFQKDEQPVRYFFDGEYEFCTRRNCPKGKFHGDPVAYKTERAPSAAQGAQHGC